MIKGGSIMENIIEIISTTGFPIVACYYMAKREEKLSSLINDICVTLKGIDTRLEIIERGEEQ